MGTYGREIREKRACLGNNGGTRGAPWTHKIVTVCVTFCVRETRSWRAMCDVRDVHFMGAQNVPL